MSPPCSPRRPSISAAAGVAAARGPATGRATATSAAGAAVVGVSVDSVASHAAFKKAHALPFPLLSDPSGTILGAYGVPTSPQGYAARTTFVIRDGLITEIFPDVDVMGHAERVLAVL